MKNPKTFITEEYRKTVKVGDLRIINGILMKVYAIHKRWSPSPYRVEWIEVAEHELPQWHGR